MPLNRFILALVSVIAALQASSYSFAQQSEAPYRIGVLAALSGDSASVGEPIRDALLLARDEVLRNGRPKLEVSFEDDRMSPKEAVSAFGKLIAANRIQAVILFGSAIGNAIAPIAERKKIVCIALVASDSKVWSNRRYVFSHWMPLESQAAAMVDEIQRRNYSRIGMISHEQEGINAIDDIFLKELAIKKLSNLVVLKEKYSMDTTDFRTYLAKARREVIQAAYVVMLPGASAFARQARDQGLAIDLFGVQTFENQDELVASKGALAGSWYVNADEPHSDFRESFTRRFGKHPGLGTANAYDSLKLVAQAVEKVGADNDKIADFLRSVKDYKGASGIYSATGDNRFNLPVAVKTITAQGFEILKPGNRVKEPASAE